MNRRPMLRVPERCLISIPSLISFIHDWRCAWMQINAQPLTRSSALGSTSVPFCNVTSKWTIAIKKLLVAPRFCDHIRKHSLPQPGLKRSLCVLQQLYHCLFVSAVRSARLFLWILVNRKNRGRLYSFVNFQQIDLICWPRQG